MPSPKSKPQKRPKPKHRLSLKWGKLKAHGEGLGVLGVILLWVSPGLIALLVKALAS